jgi:hypothetical protein
MLLDGESRGRMLAAVWSYAAGLFAVVGASAVWVSGSFGILLPIAGVALAGGLVGTWVTHRQPIIGEPGAGLSGSRNWSDSIFR